MKITEHCSCGASITVDGLATPAHLTVSEWRQDHRCRPPASRPSKPRLRDMPRPITDKGNTA